MFNSEFDRSLSMMLFSDKNNRKEIINFIRSIPNELYVKLYIQLDKYKDYEENNIDIFSREDFCLCGEYIEDDKYKYEFIIDMIQNSLTIAKSSLKDNNLKKQYGIVLYSSSRYNNVMFSGKEILGSFLNYDKNTKNEYELISTRFGLMIVNSDNGIFKKYKRFDDELCKMDIYSYLNEHSYLRVKKIV